MGRALPGVLNRQSTISDATIDRKSQVETIVDLHLPLSLHKTIRVLQQLSSGNAPESNATPAEIYNRGGPQLMEHLTALFCRKASAASAVIVGPPT
nr:unnamed protein product [Spirometra erinaceieuropaei]